MSDHLDEKHNGINGVNGANGNLVKDDFELAKDVERVTTRQYVQGINDLADLRAVVTLEQKIENDEATKDEYMVKDAYEVAIKVLSTRDDPLLKAITFRSMFLGLGLSAFGAVLAQIYYFKPQTLAVSKLFLLVISYWIGNIMAKFLPSRSIFRFINPGPFNIKEHVAIIIMASTAASSATAIQVLSVQDLYYGNEVNPGVAIFTLIGSQLIGYGYAGLLMELLVYPTKCFWPINISPANLFQALHYDTAMGSKRVKLFWAIFTFMFFWEIFPQWIFPLLSAVSIICMANHTSPVLRNVFGGGSNNEGMGLLSWCFDWNLIGSGCLINPIWTQINMDIGILLTYCLMVGVYYGNVWNGLSFPFMSQAIFAADGSEYNQTALLTNNKFDPVKYETLGPAYFSSTNALYLVSANLALGAAAVHPWLFYWDDMKPFFMSLWPGKGHEKYVVHDPHYEKMKVYPQIPKWWFGMVIVSAFAIAQATDYTGHSGLPWWTLIVLLLIGFFLCLVYALLAAVLGFYEFSSSGAGFFQMITAYMVPGDPVANMYGALYGQTPMVQGIALLQDLKLGQYIKLAPRATFLVQIMGTIVGAVLNYIMMLSIIRQNREALLSIAGTRLWSGQNAQGYNSNAIAWGALAGPMFSSPNGTYRIVPISLAIGCCLPIPFYIVHRLRPKWGVNNINTAIIMQYSCYLSVGINTSVNPSMALGIFSQWWVRKRYPRWFTKYNYIVAGALDGGTQVISFALNFAIFGAAGTAYAFPVWWGNPSLDDGMSTDRCLAPGS